MSHTSDMPVIHTRGGDDRRKASSYRRAFGGIVSGIIFIGQRKYDLSFPRESSIMSH